MNEKSLRDKAVSIALIKSELEAIDRLLAKDIYRITDEYEFHTVHIRPNSELGKTISAGFKKERERLLEELERLLK